ncbi:MAG: bifunctional [glutamate--ammonia ligase]-adenylyl-L-tyrosine phosphorylase/[glutamate--ammonia-ligase] adenylyltransferase [Verrucomicrobiota bacterium]|jgi:glutamate-ammonia-ligase adenylyltransferase
MSAQPNFDSCADPQRAKSALEQLRATSAGAALRHLSAEQARILAALLSGSQAAGELLLAHPDWLAPLLAPGILNYPRRQQGLRREVDQWLNPLLKAEDYDGAFSLLRQFKQREMLRIAARDLARLGDVPDITLEISDVADVSLRAVLCLCQQRLVRRLGRPWHLDAQGHWRETEFCLLGLGKLGGQELNYSSDVDVLFVYSEEGNVFKTAPRKNEQSGKGLANHAFFVRLAETLIAEIGKMTSDGALYRIDLRLRPEGKNGPLARSLASCENYYAQWGQTWERMMLIKARPVAGDVPLGAEFLEMIQSFRYPRSLNRGVLREVAAIKKRIETEIVKEGELERNVKLGRGGIREIEFVVQTLQLLHAGRAPFLQSGSTLPALQKLVQYSLMPADDAVDLEAAYRFLRQVEHRLQMEANRQIHTIPTERRARERLARLMDFATVAEFEAARRAHTRRVRSIYDHLLAGEEPASADLPVDELEKAALLWKELLTNHGFRDPDRSWQTLRLFLQGPDYAHISPRTVDLARGLLPHFLALCPPGAGRQPDRILSDPDRVLVRLSTFIDAYGARATLYELWTRNPSLFELLLLLFDRSEFLAEKAIRTPDLVDELEASGRLNRSKETEETLADLRHGAHDADQRLWLRRYHQAELMRIGLRDILGLADFEHNLFELSCLADACLQYALEVLQRKYRLKNAPFCVIGLGKLGGQEINYGSDLDLIFVAGSGARNLPQLHRMAAELMDLLSAQTEAGTTFATDARLRPDGDKGLLVNTIDAYEEYYLRRAALWEIQALTRVRPIAGDLETGASFQRLAASLANFTPANTAALKLAAWTPDWKAGIDQMRQRIARERTPPGKDSLAIKTGAGGLMDAEFLAQFFCLSNGWHEANTLQALRRARDAAALPVPEAESLLDNYGKLRRIEGILRRWSFAGETLLPDDPAPFHRVAVRCGFADSSDFAHALAQIRTAIRSVYHRVFTPPENP